MLTKKLSIPLQNIQHPLLEEKKVRLDILRTDKTDPIISGNKWFKLKYNLIEAQKQACTTLLSFGGPFSNHLHALATAGKAYHFNTIGIIRGEQHLPLNPTLSDLVKQEMKLYFVDRKTYRNKHLPEVIEQISQMVLKDDPFKEGKLADKFYLVPEGGTNKLAVIGASEIASFIPNETNYVCVPCGTGGTMTGIIKGLADLQHCQNKLTQNKLEPVILGFPAMKGGQFLEQVINDLLMEQNILTKQEAWELIYDWHFGGFGKINKTLAEFMDDFEKKYSLELDPIYTAKMMYAIVSMLEMDFFPRGSRIVAIHTGGLQGKRGMEQRIKSLLS
ncbi:MAG: 1-aminocyclopropane-1-carboxylate deaminase/D-cysteine desulfhydrase [Gammaproteobacteria bacterium]|nr:1-aminocyclopropane-1-carboxylate deaminase/D-cysteine desulfhydrase [Gammaproteobacteria bacterium]